jgi:hypothetical protein
MPTHMPKGIIANFIYLLQAKKKEFCCGEREDEKKIRSKDISLFVSCKFLNS